MKKLILGLMALTMVACGNVMVQEASTRTESVFFDVMMESPYEELDIPPGAIGWRLMGVQHSETSSPFQEQVTYTVLEFSNPTFVQDTFTGAQLRGIHACGTYIPLAEGADKLGVANASPWHISGTVQWVFQGP